jgi:hypothetical protein
MEHNGKTQTAIKKSLVHKTIVVFDVRSEDQRKVLIQRLPNGGSKLSLVHGLAAVQSSTFGSTSDANGELPH